MNKNTLAYDDDFLYEILKNRDQRFDGRFFFGVTSTGIYCRPICPARQPKRENCVFFASAAEAENAGFRPCKRCRPEAAPNNAGKSDPASISLRLPCRKPYAWMDLLDFLAPRAIEGMEEVKNGVYRRVVSLNSKNATSIGWTAISYSEKDCALNAEVSLSLAPVLELVTDRLKRMFDVDTRPEDVAAVLGDMTEVCPGLRIPGCFDGFEMGVRAILGQQVTVKTAHTFVTRIVETLGGKVETSFPELYRVFPSPRVFLEADGDALGRMGVIRSRQRALRAFAEFASSGGLEPKADIESQIDDMKKLPGIGAWTAQYVAMRALNWPDAFPHTDYAVKSAMGNIPPDDILKIAERWRPWRAYATMYLWREHGKN